MHFLAVVLTGLASISIFSGCQRTFNETDASEVARTEGMPLDSRFDKFLFGTVLGITGGIVTAHVSGIPPSAQTAMGIASAGGGTLAGSPMLVGTGAGLILAGMLYHVFEVDRARKDKQILVLEMKNQRQQIEIAQLKQQLHALSTRASASHFEVAKAFALQVVEGANLEDRKQLEQQFIRVMQMPVPNIVPLKLNTLQKVVDYAKEKLEKEKISRTELVTLYALRLGAGAR